VEDVLYRHPAVLEAAVVARPDQMWGETPCAFVTLKPHADASAEDIIIFWRTHLAHFQGAAKDTPEIRRKGVDLVQLLRPSQSSYRDAHRRVLGGCCGFASQ
jgi:acyl-CoA synthetase (AMP-forming)/AMP-acid ligase II